MLKKTVLTAAILTLSASGAFAAGSEINADINQHSTMSGSKVIGGSSAAVNLEKIPVVGNFLSGKVDSSMKVNEIDNRGKIDGSISQTSGITDSVVVSSQINTLENDKNAKINSTIIQESGIDNQSVVVGATVNRINNH